MATRKRAAQIDDNSTTDLPPARPKEKALRHDVSLPLQNTSLSTVVYTIGAGALLMLAYYAYLVAGWKNAAGGWVNLALGRSHPAAEATAFGGSGNPLPYETRPPREDIEDRIKALAEELGIHPKELAGAIKPLLSPAKAEAIGKDASVTGTLVDVLTQTAGDVPVAAATGIFEKLVGNDEPPNEY